MQIHGGVFPFPCPYPDCNFGFETNGNLGYYLKSDKYYPPLIAAERKFCEAPSCKLQEPLHANALAKHVELLRLRCPVCVDFVKSTRDLVLHMAEQHPEEHINNVYESPLKWMAQIVPPFLFKEKCRQNKVFDTNDGDPDDEDLEEDEDDVGDEVRLLYAKWTYFIDSSLAWL